MFNNVNAKKRLTQVMVAFVIICMTLTGSFLLLEDSINTVQAEDRTISTEGLWNGLMDEISRAGGGTWVITLGDNLTVTSGKLAAIPANANVTLKMNNKNITWNNTGSGNNNIMSTSYPFADTYWGVITNNGTLSIEGTGTISSFNTRIGYNNGSGRDNYGVKHAAIVNNGTMTIGQGITVKSYVGMSHEKGTSYQDMFVYAHGIYNASGTLTTSGTIKAGSLAQGVSAGSTGSASYAVAYSYGIYGGTVNVTGGNIYSEAMSGFVENATIPKQNNQTHNFAIGVFANNAVIQGKTNITTKSTSWRDQGSNYNTWRDGSNMSWGIGVMYYGTNYPVIGPGVNIDSSYHLNASESSISFPEYDTAIGSWTRMSENGPGSYGRHAYAVAKSPADVKTAALYGGQSGETLPVDAFGGISIGTAPGTGEYLSEYVWRNGLSNRVTSTDNKSATGSNDNGTQTSHITNGAPGTDGTQYVIVYRYYKSNNTDSKNLVRVSHSYDPAILGSNDRAVVKIGSDTYTGIVSNAANDKLAYSKGGVPDNSYYYSLAGKYFDAVTPDTYVAKDINTPGNWSGGSVLQEAGNAPGAGKVMIVYMDYIIKDPTSIKVVATSSNEPINEYTSSTEFTVAYTGAPLKPGTDFNLGILDESDNNKNITNVYNISGSGSGSGNNATAVTYRYSSDNTTWHNGLPQNVGTYLIEVNVNPDTTYAASGTYNRRGAQQPIIATITPANVTISGPTSKTVTYGSAFGEIFDFNEYTAKNKSGAVVKGTWSLSGATLTTVPNAGSYANLKIVWTPDSSEGRNYGTTDYSVTLIVNKRSVNVNAGTATVTYGDAAPTFNVKYENLAAADESKQAGWLASTVFEVDYNGTWTEYYQGMPAGTYDLRIKTFGGAADANNTFTTNTTSDKLTVNKRAIVYNAVAADKTYDEKINVDVTLTYVSGNYGADPFDSTINATGTMVNANAGANKAVTVNAVTIQNANNYYLVIDNAASLTVNVAKADPTGVSVVAKPAAVTYDKAKTLASIAFDETTNAKIPGTWAWKAAATVPTVSQTSYVAVFTPNDTTNYNTLEQNVNLTVEQAHVEVTVDPITVTYGDAVPALTGSVKYDGFTGGDTLASIVYEGNTEVSTNYTPGSGVGNYTISVATNIISENYYFTANNGTITVKAKALTVTANDATITYGDATPVFDVSNVTATGFYGSDSLNSINAVVNVTTTYIPGVVTGKVGTYPINVAVSTSNKNYTISHVPGTLTVEKAVLTVTPSPKTISFGADVPKYTVAGSDYTISGFVNGDTLAKITITGAPVFTTLYNSESYINTYPVEAVTTNMASDNYTFTGAESTIRVIKADPSVTTTPTASVVNSHSLADAAFSNTGVVVNPNDSSLAVPGTFTFADTSIVPAWGTTKAYSATFTPDDTHNYNTVTVNVTVTVTVKTISGTPVIQGSAMAGSTLTVSLVSMDPATASSYTYQWYVGNSPVATTATYKVAEADIGKTIYVEIRAIEANGFKGTAKSAETEKVIKALLETTAAQLNVVLPTGIVYDAMSHAATVTIADGYNAQYFGNITVKYNGSDKAPTAAGTYVVTVDVSTPKAPADGYPENTYYGPATGIAVGEFTIARAPYTVTVLANDKTYDGSVTATATITGSGLKDENDIVYLADNARYAFEDANAGKNKTINVTNVTLLGEHAGNYIAVVEPVTATINPKVLEARATGVNKTYDMSATVGVTFIVDQNTYAPVDSASTVYLTNGTATAVSANAGEDILITGISYELAGSSKGNYVVSITNEGSATVTINKATPTVVAPTISGIVYDSTKPLSTIDLSVYTTSDGYWQFNDAATVVPTVNQKTYAATYYSKNGNYTDLPSTITVNVAPKEVILTADNKSIAYGANAPTYTISASGFTGTDSLAMIGGNITATSTYAPGSDIGSYTITINEALTRENYTFITVPGYLTVSHGMINVTAAAVDKVYDGSADVTVKFTIDSGVYAADDVRLSASSITGIASTANAGTATVSYTAPVLVGDKAKNYQLNIAPKSGTLTVVIAKADVKGVKFPSDATVEFGYDLSHVVFGEPGVGDGTFAYENATQVVPGLPAVYNNYKVIFTPTDSRNYNTQEAVVSLQVIKCVLSYTVGIAGNPQSGQTLTVVATNLPSAALEYMTYQWYRVKDGEEPKAIEGATEKSYVATDEDIGYTLKVRTAVVEGSPFIYASDANTEVMDNIEGFVGKTTSTIKEITLTFWQRLLNWLYRILAIFTGIQLGGGLLGGE